MGTKARESVGFEATKDKDVITYHLALEIMADEVEHEEDLESILEDMSGK